VESDFQGGADDSGVVLQLRGDDLGPQFQVREVFVRALGDSAADDEELGGEEELDVLQVAVELDPVLVPAQAVAFAGDGGGLRFGVISVDLEVAEFSVGDQLAVEDEGGG